MLLDDADYVPGLSLADDHAVSGFEITLDHFGEMVIVEAELQRNSSGLAITENPDPALSGGRIAPAVWPRRSAKIEAPHPAPLEHLSALR